MEYIVLGKDGKEYGPVDPETLQKWVEHGRVFKDTKIRNALMMKWNDAGTIEYLKDAFEMQEVHEEEEATGIVGKLKGLLGLAPETHELLEEEEKATAYKQKYIPSPANALHRIAAFAIDAIFISVYGVILFFTMAIYTGTWVNVDSRGFEKIAKMGDQKTTVDTTDNEGETIEVVDEDAVDKVAEPKTEKEESTEIEEEVEEELPVVFPPPASLRKTYNFFYAVFFLSILLYYGIGLGIFAQTYGMLYWGIIIVKGYNEEAFPVRTFLYAIFAFLLAPTTPIVVLVNPEHRSLQGYITGTRLISISAKTKS